jgi:hypothetical protein
MITLAQIADTRRRIARGLAQMLDVVDAHRRNRDMAWALLPRLGRLERVRDAVVASEAVLSLVDFQSLLEVEAAVRVLRREFPRAAEQIDLLLGDPE